MKVESDLICEFFKSIKYLIDQIPESIRVGDDGFEDDIDNQVSEIQKAIDSFTILNLTPVTPIEKTGLEYVNFANIYYQRTDNADFPNSKNINIKLYKHGLYLYIKKVIREMKNINLSEVVNNKLFDWIQNNTISNESRYSDLIGSDEYFMASWQVFHDIVDEIIEQRKKAPQQTLF